MSEETLRRPWTFETMVSPGEPDNLALLVFGLLNDFRCKGSPEVNVTVDRSTYGSWRVTMWPKPSSGTPYVNETTSNVTLGTFLCVGGPLDGWRVPADEVNAATRGLEVSLPDEAGLTHLYLVSPVRENLVSPFHVFLRWGELTYPEAVSLLLGRYR